MSSIYARLWALQSSLEGHGMSRGPIHNPGMGRVLIEQRMCVLNGIEVYQVCLLLSA